MEEQIVDETSLRAAALKDNEEHDDLYTKFLRGYFFPFYAKYHRHVVVLWFVVFIIGIIYGPKFLSSTRSDLSLPPDTPSYTAVRAFQKYYPLSGDTPPVFIFAHSSTVDIVCTDTENLYKNLKKFTSSRTSVIKSVTGYWELISDPELEIIADAAISDSRDSMITTISFTNTGN